jgi:hypothetical protein
MQPYTAAESRESVSLHAKKNKSIKILSVFCLFTRLLNGSKINYKVSTKREINKTKACKRIKAKTGNLYHLENNNDQIITITPTNMPSENYINPIYN